MINNGMDPELFTISAIIVGLIIEGDYTANELNSIGNWLILVGQITLTTAAQQQLINGRYQNNNGSRIKSDKNNPQNANPRIIIEDEINNLYMYIQKLERDISKLKK